MGTATSAQDNRRQVRGGIFIQLQKTAFISNDVISGMLNISLEEPFQGHNVQVALEGFEETHFTYTVSSGSGKHRRTRTVHAHGLNNFLNFSIPVYDFANGVFDGAYTLQPGQWQIPFQLVVAEKLPSSMNYFFSQSTRCHLKYRISASIIPTEVNVKPVQGFQEIFIGQQVKTLASPHTVNYISEPVVFCCCTSGKINMQATSDQSSYSPNETVNVNLDCDLSNYGKQVTSLNVTLKGNLMMKATSTARVKHIPIPSKSVNVKVTGTKVQEKVQIPIPLDISLSCTGSLITLEYVIVVTPTIDSCCCITTNTPLYIKTIINPTSQQFQYLNMPQQIQVQAPQDWNPTVLKQAEFNQQQANVLQQQQQQFQLQQQQQYQLSLQQTNSPQLGFVPAQNFNQPAMANQNQAFL